MLRSGSVRVRRAQIKSNDEPRFAPATPFLKWAGGKRQLLPELKRFVPSRFTAYTEAFLGSGALFFDLAARGRLDGLSSTLIDNNADLIGCYRALAQHPDELISHLRDLGRGHASSDAARFYYDVRDGRFNPSRKLRQASGSTGSYPPSLAAQLIYLNRTGFNGLFRLNARGEFNVPAGRYVNPRICDETNLRNVAKLLSRPEVHLIHGSFEQLLERAKPGEFIYFDPPYAPVSSTAHFRSYTADGFSPADQERLQQLVIALASRGCLVLVSNSVAPQIEALYDGNPEARRVGLVAHRVRARRAINCDGSARGSVYEYLISNIPAV